MAEEILPSSWFAEAENMDTPAERLVELARHPLLQPLVAANPATPASVLTKLSTAADPAIRLAVVQNPNTPVKILGEIAGEFPQEFLRNPIIPFLNMTHPGFIKNLPFFTWSSLLRFSSLSPVWLQQIKNDKVYQRNQAIIWNLMQLHVSLADKSGGVKHPGNVRLDYQKQLPKPVAIALDADVELFVLFMLLFPYTAPMLKEQWVANAPIAPRQIGILLSVTREVGSKTLSLLLREQSTFLLSRVARHPVTSPKLLKSLATYRAREVRRAVAINPHTPPATIYRLMSEEDASIRRAALAHPALEPLDLEIMALDKADEVRSALAALPRLTPDLFAQLATDPAPGVRAALARNLHVPLEILRTLVRDPEAVVRSAAAGNPRLPAEFQAPLLNDPVEQVRASLGGNARLLVESAIQLAQDSSQMVRKYLAANPRTPVSLLETLWQSGDVEVWRGLARHPRISPELLAQLARQGDIHARSAVAAHSRTPVEVLEELAQEHAREIWEALATNPHTPLSILERAVDLFSVDFWYRLVNHPALRSARHRPFLTLLVGKLQPLIASNRLPTWLRRAFLQYYTALPLEIVTLFAASPYWQERYLVARHPYVPVALLETLANDGICYVQEAAREALEKRHNAEPGTKDR